MHYDGAWGELNLEHGTKKWAWRRMSFMSNWPCIIGVCMWLVQLMHPHLSEPHFSKHSIIRIPSWDDYVIQRSHTQSICPYQHRLGQGYVWGCLSLNHDPKWSCLALILFTAHQRGSNKWGRTTDVMPTHNIILPPTMSYVWHIIHWEHMAHYWWMFTCVDIPYKIPSWHVAQENNQSPLIELCCHSWSRCDEVLDPTLDTVYHSLVVETQVKLTRLLQAYIQK